jgi:ethanolamine utilization protein EutA (predicted chaperonin)
MVVPLDECFEIGGKNESQPIAAIAQFLGDFVGDVAGPAFGSVEANDPDGTVVLAFQHVDDDCLQIGLLDIGLAPSTTVSAKIIHHQKDSLIVAGDD